MKVFISWSGEKSKAVAKALRNWLPYVLQQVDPWMSDKDIRAGSPWDKVLSEKLSEISFGILCLTPANCEAPWLLFEAGALAKIVDNAFVCPYLIGMEPADIPEGPLTRFQAKRSDKDGTFDLIKSISESLGKEALPEDRLKGTFEKFWPDLDETLSDLPDEGEEQPIKRTNDEMIKETLELVRSLHSRGPLRVPTMVDSSSFASDASILSRGLYVEPKKSIPSAKFIDSEADITNGIIGLKRPKGIKMDPDEGD